MEKGFFKREGLDARYVALSGKALVTAGIGGAVDFVPIPGGGSQATLKRRGFALRGGRIPDLAMDHRGRSQDHLDRTAQGQDHRLWPRGQRGLRRRRDRAVAVLQHERRSRLQRDQLPGRGHPAGRTGQRRDPGRALVLPACRQGRGRGLQDPAQDRAIPAARRRHLLGQGEVSGGERADGAQVHPRHRQRHRLPCATTRKARCR